MVMSAILVELVIFFNETEEIRVTGKLEARG